MSALDLLVGLNEEQLAVVNHAGPGPVVVVGSPGCLDGETTIIKYTRGKRHATREISLRDLYLKFNGLPSHTRAWSCLDWPTFTYSLAADGTAYMNRIIAVVSSGIKPCVRVTADDGAALICTIDHPFMRPDRSFQAPEAMRVLEESVAVAALGSMLPCKRGGKQLPAHRPEEATKYHPFGSPHTVHAVKRMRIPTDYVYRRVTRAKLAVEAAMNGLPYDVFVKALKTDPEASASFKYLDPSLEVHHKDEQPLNDALANLQVLSHAAHSRLHGKVENFHVKYWRKRGVVRIEWVGLRETYDVRMAEPDCNFCANGFFVHNSGKTKTIVARIASVIALGCDEERVLAMTFTRNAAREMNERLSKAGIEKCRVGTIHSVALEVLKTHHAGLMASLDLDEHDRLRMTLKRLLTELRKADKSASRWTNNIDIEELWRFVADCKLSGVTYVKGDPFHLSLKAGPNLRACASRWALKVGCYDKELIHIYEELEDRRAASCTYGFNDMINWAYQALLSDEGVRRDLQHRYDHVIVDECIDGRTPVLLANGTVRSIETLVAEKYAGAVQAFDVHARRLVHAKVTGWHKLLLTKKMVRLVFRQVGQTQQGAPLAPLTAQVRFGLRYLACTQDHQVYTTRGWQCAGDLTPGTRVFLESTTPRIKSYGQALGHGLNGRRKLSVLMSAKNADGRCGQTRAAGRVSVRGGNGTGPSPTEASVLAKLGPCASWNYVVRTGGKPHCYKIDVALPDQRVAIELDGASHGSRKEADARKDSVLRALGWTVLRLRNRDALRMSACDIRAAAGLDSGGDCIVTAEVVSVEEWQPESAYVYDLDVEGLHTYLADGIVVHNCQDSNVVQYGIAAMLAGNDDQSPVGAPKLLSAGDLSQAIFGFQGGNPSILGNLAKDKRTKVYKLPTNYRSVPEVCRVSYALVKGKPWHLVGEIKPVRVADGTSAPVQIRAYPDPGAEAVDAVRLCREYAEAHGGSYRECAILTRIGVGLNDVELECIRHRIPYIKRASGSFASSIEVKDLMAYMRVACMADPNGRWQRHIINTPFRYIGRDALDAAETVATSRGCSMLEALQRHVDLRPGQMRSIEQLMSLLVDLNKDAAQAETQAAAVETAQAQRAQATAQAQTLDPEEYQVTAADLLTTILTRTQYVDSLRREEGLAYKAESREAVIGSLQRVARYFASPLKFIAYIDALTVAMDQAKKSGIRRSDGDADAQNALVLSTIHSAKALEWDHVHLVDVTAGHLPHSKGDHEEELRLLYVAVSRAKSSCVVSYAQDCCPSEYIGLLRSLSVKQS